MGEAHKDFDRLKVLLTERAERHSMMGHLRNVLQEATDYDSLVELLPEYATSQDWCGTYDEVVQEVNAHLGDHPIPERKNRGCTDFRVSINGGRAGEVHVCSAERDAFGVPTERTLRAIARMIRRRDSLPADCPVEVT